MVDKTEFGAAVQAAQKVRGAVAVLHSRKTDLDMEAKTLKSRIEHLLSLPVSRDDAKRFILDTVDRIGAEYPELAGWQKPFADFASPKGNGRREKAGAPLSLRDIEQMAGGGQMELASVLGSDHGSFFYGSASLADFSPAKLYFFFGDIVKKRIEEHFDKFFPEPWTADPEAETPIAQRRAEIAASAERCRAIGVEIDDINEQLRQLRA